MPCMRNAFGTRAPTLPSRFAKNYMGPKTQNLASQECYTTTVQEQSATCTRNIQSPVLSRLLEGVRKRFAF